MYVFDSPTAKPRSFKAKQASKPVKPVKAKAKAAPSVFEPDADGAPRSLMQACIDKGLYDQASVAKACRKLMTVQRCTIADRRIPYEGRFYDPEAVAKEVTTEAYVRQFEEMNHLVSTLPPLEQQAAA